MCMDEHDEYEELLHYAVNPKLEMFNTAHLKPLSTSDILAERLHSQRDEDPSQHSAGILFSSLILMQNGIIDTFSQSLLTEIQHRF